MSETDQITKFKTALSEAIEAYDAKDEHLAIGKLIWALGWLGDAVTVNHQSLHNNPKEEEQKQQ